ncbi:unnamed protein product, partial [Mesorhabditis spiculigera]
MRSVKMINTWLALTLLLIWIPNVNSQWWDRDYTTFVENFPHPDGTPGLDGYATPPTEPFLTLRPLQTDEPTLLPGGGTEVAWTPSPIPSPPTLST